MKEPESLFEINNLKKGRRLDLEALALPRQALTVISGKTGCGKSTLISLLGLLHKPDHNRATRMVFRPEKGHEIDYLEAHKSRTRMEQIRRDYFGFVFQNDQLIDSLSCFENVIYPVLVRRPKERNSQDSLKKTVTEWLDYFEFSDLKETLDRSPATLSGGQRQRLALIRGVIHDPAIVMADEPVASVDQNTAFGIVKALKKFLQRPSKTIILVIHDKDLGLFEGLLLYHISLDDYALKTRWSSTIR